MPPSARRIIASDDEDEEEGISNSRPKPKGLRGRVPAAIQRLIIQDSDEDEEDGHHGSQEDTAQRYLDIEAEDSDEVSSDGFDSANDSAGSLDDFIADDDASVEHSELSDPEIEESYEAGAVSEPEESDDEPARPRPRISQVYKYDDPNDSLGSLREMLVADSDSNQSSASFVPSSSSRTSVKPVMRQTYEKTMAEVIEILDSSDEEDEVASGPSDVALERGAVLAEDGESEDDDDDGGILHFSPPPRPIKLPDIGALTVHDTDDEAPEPKSKQIQINAPPPKPKASRAVVKAQSSTSMSDMSKKEWETYRVKVAQELFDELDRDVFDRKLGAAGAGATLEWSAHLRTSAGNANRKR